MKLLMLVSVLFVGLSSYASTNTFCGVRSGTAGNASLEGKNGITLAVQGGDQTLLDQVDSLITALGPDASGESGTQNGSRYCVNAKIVNNEAAQIISAFRE